MIDWSQVGTAIAAVTVTGGTLAGSAWAWWQRHQKVQAQDRADIAESNADRTVADAQQTVYKLLGDRVGTLENEVRGMRSELAAERAHNRQLVLHIWKLEGLMRKAGIEPPPFEDGQVKVGGTET